MNIADILPRVSTNPNDFRRFWGLLFSEAVGIKNKWEFLAGKRSGVRVHDGGLGWWGAQYLKNGQIVVKRNRLGFQIYYQPTKGNKNYEKVVEDGRPQFDIVASLMKSRKVRISANGKKYLIVPMNPRENSSGTGGGTEPQESLRTVLTITGTYREKGEDGQTILRNKYASSTVQVRDKYIGGKNTVIFRQQNEKGGSSSVTKNLVMVTSESNWKPYPAVKPQKFVETLQKVADTVMANSEVRNKLAEALFADILDYVNKRKRKRNG